MINFYWVGGASAMHYENFDEFSFKSPQCKTNEPKVLKF